MSEDLALRRNLRYAAVGLKSSLLDAALPHLRGLDSHRFESVLRAFHQLEILHREGVVLMTPEFLVR